MCKKTTKSPWVLLGPKQNTLGYTKLQPPSRPELQERVVLLRIGDVSMSISHVDDIIAAPMSLLLGWRQRAKLSHFLPSIPISCGGQSSK